ncbi:hypothetical protein CKAN_01243100 [Cinnamomum micranthum f. kanehirae]|uniref:Uncharacterized protein n=1 Tax=Cinnamomum micranthum f. kanehirae TaxID=337451 RepID=A0A443NYP8_9MAGN|nr:hypothetical protein CKAN_01243100 [Cinnamomum micranthum f. kanehirae]
MPSRPELRAPPEFFYNEEEAPQIHNFLLYHRNSGGAHRESIGASCFVYRRNVALESEVDGDLLLADGSVSQQLLKCLRPWKMKSCRGSSLLHFRYLYWTVRVDKEAGIYLSPLMVLQGKLYWNLYIDGLLVSSDENLFGAWEFC